MKHTLYLISLLVLLPISFSSCKKKGNSQGENKDNSKTAKNTSNSRKLTKPTTYCEKKFYCSFQTLVTKKAKDTVLLKQKAFISKCETVLSHFPLDLVAEFKNCITKKCGTELKTCIENASTIHRKKSKITKVIKKTATVGENPKTIEESKKSIKPEEKTKPSEKSKKPPLTKEKIKTPERTKTEKVAVPKAPKK
jgi:hypothetical protein